MHSERWTGQTQRTFATYLNEKLTNRGQNQAFWKRDAQAPNILKTPDDSINKANSTDCNGRSDKGKRYRRVHYKSEYSLLGPKTNNQYYSDLKQDEIYPSTVKSISGCQE